ncbi:MAG: hypothetical protein FJZ78_06900 [Bacteroidetes bacterium]|nr:hypothetical protein [Bacteroidota bacterium]
MRKSLRKLFGSRLLFASLFSLTLTGVFGQVEVSVPFNKGFIGFRGNNVQDANNITLFSSLGIQKAFFVQVNNTNSFIFVNEPSQQGNDIRMTLRLQMVNGQTVDIPGGLVWERKEQGQVVIFGFLALTSVNFNLNQYGGSNFQINGGQTAGKSNFGLVKINKEASFTSQNTNDVRGDAATSGLLADLNAYLNEISGLRPQGSVTVSSLTTCSTNPTINGGVTLAAGESLSVYLNGSVFNSSTSPAVVVSGGTWSLNLPTNFLSAGNTYSVTATIINAAGYTLSDATANELVVSAAAAGTISGTSNICLNAGSGTVSNDLVVTVSNGSIIKWQSATLADFSNAVDIANSTATLTVSVNTTAVSTEYYRAILNSGCGNTPTTGFRVSVTDCSTDTDGDGVTDSQEITDGTNPNLPCSFILANQTLTPNSDWNRLDCDGDGVENGTEINNSNNTNPLNNCSFVLASQTLTPDAAWNSADCDNDGRTNSQEKTDGTDPLDPDTDGDGVKEGQEATDNTNPKDLCS